MSLFIQMVEVFIVIMIVISIKSKKQGKNKNKKQDGHNHSTAADSARSVLANAVVGKHDHFGDAKQEGIIHATIDSAKETGLICLNGKLYTKDQLKGI